MRDSPKCFIPFPSRHRARRTRLLRDADAGERVVREEGTPAPPTMTDGPVEGRLECYQIMPNRRPSEGGLLSRKSGVRRSFSNEPTSPATACG